MAREWGEVGSARALRRLALDEGLDPDICSPAAMSQRLGLLEALAPTEAARRDAEHAVRIDALRERIAAEALRVQAAESAIDEETGRLRDALIGRRREWRGRGLLSRLVHLYVPISVALRAAVLDREHASRISELHGPVVALKKHLVDLEEERPSVGARAEAALRGEMEVLREILATPEAIGARAEIEVSAALRQLPEPFWVLHDVTLRAPHFLRHGGKPLLSAQIDHVVVGPPGVVVIETKLWSKAWAARSGEFSPYEQVARAGKLTWVMLKEAGWQTRVRNVIATRGSLPPREAEDYTKVLAPEDLPAYIRRLRAELGPERVDGIAAALRAWSRRS